VSRVALETIEKTTVERAWPSFSIVIPTYQRREVVCSAVRALAETDYPGDRELIVVVDGSTDGTAASLNDIL
jgi:glycosyltransferase involved in cell wall biosynthesis